MAAIKKKFEMAGTGCLIQGIGMLLLFVYPIGTIIGVILFLWGSSKSVYYACSNCGNRITDKDVKICPTCKEQLINS